MQNELMAYVAAELADAPVHRRYPQLWLHIYHCPACLRQHRQLIAAQRAAH